VKIATASPTAHAVPLCDVPFWNFFGVQHVFYGEPDPTEAQVRWQAFTSLAFGAKGLLYFCYWTGILVQKVPFQSPNATPSLVLTHHYGQAQRTNSRILAFAEHLRTATSVAVYDFAAAAPGVITQGIDATRGVRPAGTLPAALVIGIAGVSGQGPPQPFLVGEFALADGRAAVLLQNQGYAFNAVASVVLSPAALALTLCEVSPDTGIESALLNDGPGPDLQMIVEAGSARLLVMSMGSCAGS
jgi:hypothetical protein